MSKHFISHRREITVRVKQKVVRSVKPTEIKQDVRVRIICRDKCHRVDSQVSIFTGDKEGNDGVVILLVSICFSYPTILICALRLSSSVSATVVFSVL